jgi:hypothetical protein
MSFARKWIELEMMMLIRLRKTYVPCVLSYVESRSKKQNKQTDMNMKRNKLFQEGSGCREEKKRGQWRDKYDQSTLYMCMRMSK